MNLTEILKAKNIEDDVIKSIVEDMKANKIFTASEENLDIRYGKLKSQNDTLKVDYENLKKDHETMKQSSGDSAELLKQAAEKDATIAALQAKLEETQIDADVHVELLSAGVKPDDIDYVMFKLKAKGKLERGDDGKIKDMDDKIAALKTQLPGQFTSESKKNILENKLPSETENGDAITKESLLKKPYAERMKIFNENPEAYKNAMNN